MIRSLNRWINQFVISNPISGALIILSLVGANLALLIPYGYELACKLFSLQPSKDYTVESCWPFYMTFMCLAGMVYGVSRVTLFHPIGNVKYLKWLQNTPWRRGMPLPVGPLHPVWQDGLLYLLLYTAVTITAGVIAENYSIDFSWRYGLMPVVLAAAGTGLMWTIANLCTKEHWANRTVAVGIPTLLILQPNRLGLGMALLLVLLVGYWGVWRSLSRFPWKGCNTMSDFNANTLKAFNEKTKVAWPYRQLLVPPDNDRRLPRHKALACALLGILWLAAFDRMFAGVINDPEADYSFMQNLQLQVILLIPLNWMLVAGVAICLGMFRLVFDRSAMCRRFCVGERLSQGHLIVPHHDRLFLNALLIAAPAIPAIMFLQSISFRDLFMGKLMVAGGLPVFLTSLLLIGLPIYLFFRLGRPIEEGFYTGPQSLTPGIMTRPNRAQFAKLATPGD